MILEACVTNLLTLDIITDVVNKGRQGRKSLFIKIFIIESFGHDSIIYIPLESPSKVMWIYLGIL